MEKLAKILKEEGVAILPTETVYGLFAQALSQKAVDTVYQLKQRPREKALNLNVASLEDILYFSQNPPLFLKKVYNRFMPGPLTIILKSNKNVPFWVNSGLDTVGFRVPNHEKTLRLIREVGPLIGPSANLSGKESGKKFAELVTTFAREVDGLEDDQAITGIDSTILDLSKPQASILRQGAISKEEIQDAVPEILFETEVDAHQSK